MALVVAGAGSGFSLSVTLTDNSGNQSTLTYALTSADYATAQADSATILNALAAVTDATISGYAISIRYYEDAFAYPGAGVENEIRARITGQLVGSTKKATLEIPAPNNDIFLGDSGESNNIVDVTDLTVLAYCALFDTGGYAFISDGEHLDFPIRGRKVSVKRGMRA